MPPEGSVTRWLGPLQAGDPAAAQQLWERYFRRLVGLARKKLHGVRRLRADEEDVALSAFDSFCRCAEQGRFPQLADRDNLWRLMMTITARKAAHLLRDEGRRSGRVAESASPTTGEAEQALEQVLSREPDPALAAQVAEEYQQLLRALADPELQAVAVWKIEGYSVQEIAAKLGYAARSVKRKLRLIREIWEREGQP
jgi:DNA-directed RNA polymerase specialized sigma24 family protein